MKPNIEEYIIRIYTCINIYIYTRMYALEYDCNYNKSEMMMIIIIMMTMTMVT